MMESPKPVIRPALVPVRRLCHIRPDIAGHAQNAPAIARRTRGWKIGAYRAMQPKAPMSTVVDRQPASHKKCVLIVDDDLELSSIYQHLLETFNYEVNIAANGKVALEKILSRDVDAIICDLRMPELEGDLFYSTIERVKPYLCRRFIFLTGAADDPKYHSFLSQVKSPVLLKPVHPERLLMELQRLPDV
jgi:CheY-like chemotaxis protein